MHLRPSPPASGRRVWTARAAALLAVTALAAAAASPEWRAEQERIADLRALHVAALQNLHDARALALYLASWGGTERAAEVESLLVEGAGLHGWLRGADHGGMALQAQTDVLGPEACPPEQLALLQRARRTVAAATLDFAARSAALKTALTEAVTAAAQLKAQWRIESRPEPWPDAAREAGRQRGLRFGWELGEAFFAQPPEEQDRQLAKAARTGTAFATLAWRPLGDWADIEKAEGQYDFGALDAALERCRRAGLAAAPMLYTLAGTPPAWHLEREGAAARFLEPAPPPKNAKDQPAERLSGINLFHPPTAAAFEAFLAAYARHLRERWANTVEAAYADGGLRELEAPDDRSAAMQAWWRQWSQTDTPWRAPEELRAAEPPDWPAVVRAEQCREAWLAESANRVAAALRRGWPELAVQFQTSSDDFHRLFVPVTGRSRNLPALCRLGDNPSTATDSPASFALLRSFAGGRWLWSQELHDGCGTCGGAAIAQAPFYDSTHIVKGSFNRELRAAFPQSWFRYPDGQHGGFGLSSFVATPRRCQEMASLILNTEWTPAPVAILWSQDSLRLDRNMAAFKSAIAWGHLLARTFFRYDYVTEATLAGRLPAATVLILPDTPCLSAEAAAAIRAWVEKGGVLLGFGAPATRDEAGRPLPAPALADVFGAAVERLRVPGPVTPDRLETTHPEGSYQFGNLPPRPYKFEETLTAVLRPATATPRAWFAGSAKDVAICENRFGAGRALLCGFPLGFEYWESAPYELAFGFSHARHLNYNMEQKRYEAWVTRELEAAGVTREVVLPVGRFLRAQRGDDPDWYHVYRDAPSYTEYMFEEEKPVRTVYAFPRRRDGIDNLYLGLSQSEANFMWETAHFHSTLAASRVTAAVALPAPAEGQALAPVVWDVRLKVPVPATVRDGRATFETWLPVAQSAAFAVAPAGAIRLFGDDTPAGEPVAVVAARVAASREGEGLRENEVLDPAAIAAWLAGLPRDREIVIGCGDVRLRAVAEAARAWLEKDVGLRATITSAQPRASCRHDYMDGFGWPQYGADPVRPDLVVGNAQENGLMWRFLTCHGWCGWLPLEVNRDFPGPGRSVVMLSCPVRTQANGKPGGQREAQQLVIGASFPAEAAHGLAALQTALGSLPR
ncbi:MAG: Beta-galactosidase trimerization domain protein [Lentisphaerae bacterium ADurb.BinA184]|nr:MAG: Beta-galactosidase trimerization domain protein [Lentisphaerae bacterium ADurb.BinA184]